jgi:hypothetical protein
LDALVDYFNDSSHGPVFSTNVGALVPGLTADDVALAIESLAEASPPYLNARVAPGMERPATRAIEGVTERARRETGQWPTADALADAFLSRLQQAASDESDPERSGWARKVLELGPEFVRDFALNVASNYLAGQIPH